MSVIDAIKNKDCWLNFLKYKQDKKLLTKSEEKELIEFIESNKYINEINKIISNNYSFSIPKKVMISKNHKQKKRSVFIFNREETWILKFIYYSLNKYDNLFSNNLYSYRKSIGVKKAFYDLVKTKNINNMYGYKLDVSDYFNSINVKKITNILYNSIKDDKELLLIISNILLDNRAVVNNEIIECKKGVLAGCAISGFLANLYLSELDKHFYKSNVKYARYADDIIIFCKTREELNSAISFIKEYLYNMDLNVNKEKEYYFNKGDKWEFLGFSYQNYKINISDNSFKKIKAKIRRSARSIRRWKLSKNMKNEYAIKTMISKFNNKFFNDNNPDDLSFSRWYFPVINQTDRLKEIDNYLQNNIRYIISGKHNKMNYKCKYNYLKKYGYRTLINEYYKRISN